MPDTCTVSADDVRAICFLLSQAKVLHTWMTAIPAFDAAFDAATRMAAALAQGSAEQDALPPSPVNAFEEMAIFDRHTHDAYMAQGFDDDQAFEILRMLVAMRCNIHIAGANHG